MATMNYEKDVVFTEFRGWLDMGTAAASFSKGRELLRVGDDRASASRTRRRWPRPKYAAGDGRPAVTAGEPASEGRAALEGVSWRDRGGARAAGE